MNNISDFFVGPFLIWFPFVTTVLIFVLAIFLYLKRHQLAHLKFKKILNFRNAIILAVAFRVFYALFVSVAQYYVWKNGGDFTSFLANSPIDEKVPPTFFTELFPGLFQSKFGYVAFYSLGRYGLNVLWSIAAAFIFWAFLRVLKKYNERFFDIKETELGLLCALIVGWPNLVVFIPLVFVSVIFVSIVRGLLFREAYTTLGWPFLLATAVCLAVGSQLVDMFNLSVLRI